MNFFRGVMIGLALSCAIWALLISVVKADHKGPVVEVGDTVRTGFVCVRQSSAALVFRRALTIDVLSDEDVAVLKKTCVQTGVVGKKLELRVTKILVHSMDIEGDDAYLVRLSPFNGVVLFSAVYNSNIIKKGDRNGRRTDRRGRPVLHRISGSAAGD